VRLLRYLYGPGKANEHTDPHLVAGFGDPAKLEPERRSDGSPDLRRLAGLLVQPLAALDGGNYDKPVWHCSLRAAPDRGVSAARYWRIGRPSSRWAARSRKPASAKRSSKAYGRPP
jgi:hypothetical protein